MSKKQFLNVLSSSFGEYRPKDGIINIKDFGATGDGVTDDTNAIKLAISQIKKLYGDKGGGSVLFPVPEKFYKISDTLDFSEIWNFRLYCEAPYAFNRADDVNNNHSLLHWYGAADKEIMLFHYCFGVRLENITINGRNIPGVVGMSLGMPITQNSSVKFFLGVSCHVKYCDIGIRVGDLAANGPDVAGITFTGSYLTQNKTNGIRINSGNADVKLDGLFCEYNGTLPVVGQKGCNICLLSGELVLTGYCSSGEPADADIYMGGGGIRVNGAWSDIGSNRFIHSDWATSSCSFNGVRHYNGGMTVENTPLSIEWLGPQPLVLNGCYLFNSVKLNAGLSGHVVDLGTKFITETATFIGGGLDNMGYLGLGGYKTNQARLEVGKPARNDVGSQSPLTVWSLDRYTSSVMSTNNGFVVTENLFSGVSLSEKLGNCYNENGVYKSIAVGACWVFQIRDTGLTFLKYTASAPAEIINDWVVAWTSVV